MESIKKLIFNQGFPSYAQKKYDSFILMKFFPSKEYRDYFLSGKLYMRQHTEFAKEELGEGRADFTEGAEIVAIQRNSDKYLDIRFVQNDDGEVLVRFDELSEKPANYREHQMFISYPVANQQRNIFCMYTLWMNVKADNLCVIDKDCMSKFGEYGILIIKTSEFLNRVAQAINNDENISKAQCGFVEYFQEENAGNIMKMHPFLKPATKYAHQYEFRVCVDTNNKDLLELDLGCPLTDIAIPITLSVFSGSVRLNRGSLLFQSDEKG